MRARLLPALAWLSALTLPASGHDFHPSTSAGLDVFLDQGPAVLEVEGGYCKAAHSMEIADPTVAVPAFGAKTANNFFLPVFGKKAGLTTLTVTVGNGKGVVAGEVVPCGENDTQYVFSVRVWPSRKLYDKKLSQLIANDLKAYQFDNKGTLKALVAAIKQAIGDAKTGVSSGPNPVLGLFAVAGSSFNAEYPAQIHKRLNDLLVGLAQKGAETLVDCGFAEDFVAGEGFATDGQAGGGKPGALAAKTVVSTEKTLAAVEKLAKKSIDAVGKIADGANVFLDGNLTINDAPWASGLVPFDVTGPLAERAFGDVFVSAAATRDAVGLDPVLEVSGLGPPDDDVIVGVRDGTGVLMQRDVRTDGGGLFHTTFDKGLPPGANVEVFAGARGSESSLLHTVANASRH